MFPTIKKGVASLLFLLMAACSNNSTTRTTHESRDWGTPGTPVGLSYSLPEKLDLGEKVPLTLEVKTGRPHKTLKLVVAPGQGVSMAGIRYEKEWQPGEPPPYEVTLSITPRKKGLLYVNVFVTADFGSGQTARTLSIPLNVGKGGPTHLQKPGTLQKDSRGQSLVVLPAEE